MPARQTFSRPLGHPRPVRHIRGRAPGSVRAPPGRRLIGRTARWTGPPERLGSARG
ncbi:hypothetical protein SLNWT_4274 [Streptomyces albus]|uniref:Uncharacterized protein n=1 Tax=Streptomyces albus (strain ATCC 21838 / DSM 41398 / FERM P-419 / JCM 4703 / NBRC 107858) TaxID=1081613 RepID=A0A0B5EZ37_STRA4|nr:hypothetical protein SLNWT_4274 [Streptomyces albus]AOU78958.1 hypothetical protein SLNHY_4267 [Streptomyces albus]AYN34693.1 hypothetical protein DUI70_4194 [Streptomyces albus]